MPKRLIDLLVFVAESVLPFHARPPASIRRCPAPRPTTKRPMRVIATAIAALLVAGSAGAGGFGTGAAAGGGLGGVGAAPTVTLEALSAVQHYHGHAVRALTERDCESRYRSFQSRTTLSPSRRKQQLLACLDVATTRLQIAQRGE